MKIFKKEMKSQVSKMRLISMFYLMVFASALLLSGILNSQREIFPIAKGNSTAVIFSASTDSIPAVKNINVSAEPGSGSEDVTESDDKQDFSPFEFDFSFNSLIQWFFRLPAKNLGVKSHSHTINSGQPIWLSILNLRI